MTSQLNIQIAVCDFHYTTKATTQTSKLIQLKEPRLAGRVNFYLYKLRKTGVLATLTC